jgi:hypothetical protein
LILAEAEIPTDGQLEALTGFENEYPFFVVF